MTNFTQRNNTIMSWMLMHMAEVFKDAGGYDQEGSNSAAWKAGCRFDYTNAEYRA